MPSRSFCHRIQPLTPAPTRTREEKLISRRTDICQGPISWQQEARLRNELDHGRYPNIWSLFTVPEWLTDHELRRRLSLIVEREQALRIVNVTLDRGGEAHYAPVLDPPLSTEHCETRDEAVAFARRAAARHIARDGDALWEILLIEHPGPAGRRVRLACGVFDHLVSDGRSRHLLRQELTARHTPFELPRNGPYRDWVIGQRQRFPSSPGQASSPAREFWLEHLDGTTADRPTPVPFAVAPSGVRQSFVTTISMDVPVPVESLRLTASRRRVTPFLLVLAAVASVVADGSDQDDITLRVISNGRPLNHLNTQGWFADSIPIRLRHPSLGDFDQALASARTTWSRLLPFHDTPWDFIRWVCAPAGAVVPEKAARGQLVVNFVPFQAEQIVAEPGGESTAPGDIDGLHLLIRFFGAQCRLMFFFNPDHFSKDGTRAFLDQLATRLSDLTAPAHTGA